MFVYLLWINETLRKMPTAKKKAAPAAKKKPSSKVLVLNTALFIGAVEYYEQDGKRHVLGGKTYPAGTVVNEAMKLAYEKNAALVGGTTKFEAFCLEVQPEKAAPIEIEIEGDEG